MQGCCGRLCWKPNSWDKQVLLVFYARFKKRAYFKIFSVLDWRVIEHSAYHSLHLNCLFSPNIWYFLYSEMKNWVSQSADSLAVSTVICALLLSLNKLHHMLLLSELTVLNKWVDTCSSCVIGTEWYAVAVKGSAGYMCMTSKSAELSVSFKSH